MPLDYFVWAIKGPDRTFVFDTGFDAPMGEKRERQFLRSPCGRAEGDRRRARRRARRDPVAHALRPLRQLRSVPARALSRAGHRDGVLHRPVHVPCGTARAVRGRGRGGDGAQAVRRPRRVPRRRGRTGAGPDRCITSADTRRACRWCGCGRGAAGWCWRPMPATSTPTWRKAAPSRSCTATRTRWRATRRCGSWRARRTRSFPGHDPLVLQRYPAATPGLEGIVVRLDVEPH